MVNMLKRMRVLHELLDIRLGPGAAILPPEVKRINLQFAVKLKGGHMGPRKFWRDCLPRLKYHNPAIPMTISRFKAQDGPANLTIHWAAPGTPSNPSAPTMSTSGDQIASDHTPVERVQVIDVKHKHSEEILAEFMQQTKAEQVEPTEDELLMLADLKDRARRGQEDRERTKADFEAKRREKAILEQARRSVGL